MKPGTRKQAIILGALLVVALLNLSMMLLLWEQSKEAASRDLFKNVEEGSPYAPWPLSHPKMCGGILLFEKDAKELAVTPPQAKRLLPVLRTLGGNWKVVHEVAAGIKRNLSASQQEYVFKNKHVFETRAFIRDNIPPSVGMNSLDAAAYVLERRVKDGTGGAVTVDAPGREYLLTMFDMGAGIFMMDRLPGLAVSREQAEKLLPLYRRAQKIDRTVTECTDRMAAILDRAQIAYIQSHMLAVTHAKRAAFDERNEKGPYDDPLLWLVIRLLEKRSGQKVQDAGPR